MNKITVMLKRTLRQPIHADKGDPIFYRVADSRLEFELTPWADTQDQLAHLKKHLPAAYPGWTLESFLE